MARGLIWRHSLIRLVVASDNAHKVREIQSILSGLDVVAFSTEYGHRHSAIEDGLTFESNAIKKIEHWPLRTGVVLLADDSGLEVDALDKRPGIHSARYAGLHATSHEMCHKLLSEMAGHTHRSARFRCVIAVRFWNDKIITTEGVIDGTIAQSIQGNDGFGYDPIFIPEGANITFANMSPAQKNALSHRGRALEKISRCIEEFDRSL